MWNAGEAEATDGAREMMFIKYSNTKTTPAVGRGGWRVVAGGGGGRLWWVGVGGGGARRPLESTGDHRQSPVPAHKFWPGVLI